ncbi:MAG: hypothetical protein RMK18_06100 [Armatimonadota bacterium]|nr:hypothetical protein [Armatimonadota bacterium]MCX7777762.1 hypothetical protein [Armatimonadota bacterium]MDW8025419.1 hypothetical protein [Armatimonadota bacterium]
MIEIADPIRAIKIPKVKMAHLSSITDDTGVLQHTKYGIPNPKYGYTTDDNARALLASVKHYELTLEEESLMLARTYLAFLQWMQREDGLFHNEASYDRRILDEVGSLACQGHAVWALSWTAVSKIPLGMRVAAFEMLEQMPIESILTDTSIHVPSFVIYGLAELKEKVGSNGSERITMRSSWELVLENAVEVLLNLYKQNASDDWKWFIDEMTWGVGAPCAALFRAYRLFGDEQILHVALSAYEFMCDVVFEGGLFQPIGCKGWFRKNGKRAYFDQQPIEAMWMFFAAQEAFKCLGRKLDIHRAMLALGWFFGLNVHGVELYDESTGACYDGLHEFGINMNQGAEATIAALLTLIAFVQSDLCKNK